MEANTKFLITVVGEDQKYLKFIHNTVTESTKFQIEGEYRAEQELISNLHTLKSNIYLIDSNLHGMTCLECIKKLKLNDNNSRVLVVVGNGENEQIFRAIRSGANGYLGKSTSSEKLIEILEDVNNGGAKMSYLIIGKILEFLEDKLLINPEVKLSSREKEILSLLNTGVTCKGIALKLFLSQATARTHIRNIKLKIKQNEATDLLIIPRHFKQKMSD
jgi:NarL family two-component system response regulator LiaR